MRKTLLRLRSLGHKINCWRKNISPNAPHRHRLTVALIYLPNPSSINTYAGSLSRLTRFWLTQKQLTKGTYQHYLPNNLVRELQAEGEIRLIEVALPIKPSYDAHDAGTLPNADVWIFSLLNHSSELLFAPSFLKAAQERARADGIQTINLASHTGSPEQVAKPSKAQFPMIAKLRGNGETLATRPSSFAFLPNQTALTEWKDTLSIEQLSLFEVESYIEHRRKAEFAPYRCIERWIYVCGDLTVGIRLSQELIIKQLNSVTSYLRDPRCLSEDHPALTRQRMQTSPLKQYGVQPLSFSYANTAEFWDPRHALCQRLHDETGVEICSLDIIEDDEQQLHLIDYNEHTWESAPEDLRRIWKKNLLNAIQSSLKV